MKYFTRFQLVALSIFFLYFVNIQAEDPESLISINFGNTINQIENNGALFLCNYWNVIYKGNSTYLLNEKNEQSDCFLRTNATSSAINLFNQSEDNLMQSYLVTHDDFYNLTLFNVPYDSYTIYLYLTHTDINEKPAVSVNGLPYDAVFVHNETSEYIAIHADQSQKIDLSVSSCVNICAVQILKTEKQKNITNIPKISEASVVYPTTVEQMLNFDLTGFTSGRYNVQIDDISGRIIQNYQLLKDAFTDIYQIELNNLNSGIYTVFIQGDNVKFSQQIWVK